MLDHATSPSRRLSSRVTTKDSVWVYWECEGRAETSAVQDISLGGVFLITPKTKPIDAKAELHFLVQEGQIRTEAVVRHLEPARGLGMKFTAVKDSDRPQLIRLMTRLRSLSRSALSQHTH